MISSNANSTLPSTIPSSVTTDTSSYLAKTEPKMEEIDSELNATTGYGRSSNQVGSPSSSSPVVSQQSVIQTSPSLENSISQGHQSSPVVPLTPEAPVVTVSYQWVISMSHKSFLARIFDIVLPSVTKSKYFCLELSLSRDSLFKYLFWYRCIQVNFSTRQVPQRNSHTTKKNEIIQSCTNTAI